MSDHKMTNQEMVRAFNDWTPVNKPQQNVRDIERLDRFIAAALSGLCARTKETPSILAQTAYRIGAAMLAECQQHEKTGTKKTQADDTKDANKEKPTLDQLLDGQKRVKEVW